jgi:ParB/RepB/Spo0J family partition protein
MKSHLTALEVGRSADPIDFIGQVVRISTSRVKQLPGQPRTFFDPRELQRLRDSIAEIGQQQPAVVVPWEDGDFRLRDGERRWRCCVALKIPLLALVAQPKSAEEEFELSAAANMNRASHSPLEKAHAMKRLRDGPLKRSVAEIARTFGVTDVTVYSHLLVLDSLPQQIVDLMDPNKQGERKRTLQISAAVRLTALKEYPKEQLALALKIVRGDMPLSQAMRLIDHFADAKKVHTGRGRERKPSDWLDLLTGSLLRLKPHTDYFYRQSQNQIDELFAFVREARRDELAEQLDNMVKTLQTIQRRVEAVQNVGARRAAGAM